jgi:HlyD family secretion protein
MKSNRNELLVAGGGGQSMEGMELLAARFHPAGRWLIYLIAFLLAAVLCWSFFGQADVIVDSEGRIEPRVDIRQVYVPIDCELVAINVNEGSRVSEGQLLARMKAKDAIQAATDAEQARIKLEQAELQRNLFPRKKSLMKTELENLEVQIVHKREEIERYRKQRFRNLPALQRHKLEKTRLKRDQARRDRDVALEIMEKYRRLLAGGNGGFSAKEVEEKEDAFRKADTAYREATIDLENLEFEFFQQSNQMDKSFADAQVELLRLQYQRDSKDLQIRNEEKQVDIQYRAALAEWEAASVITFDDLDGDNFLRIHAPVAGEVTQVQARQRGEKIRPDAPLISIAPNRAEKVLTIRIPENERGLLREGQPVRLKFKAYPYFRYGVLEGTLEFISPDTFTLEGESPFYKGRVGLGRDFFRADGKTRKLKYGMTATAEIAVQRRRLIELVLDPFRKLSDRVEI